MMFAEVEPWKLHWKKTNFSHLQELIVFGDLYY